MPKTLFLTASLILAFTFSEAQLKYADSLHRALKNADNDTIKMFVFNHLGDYYSESNRDSSLYYDEAAIAMAKKINQPLFVADFLCNKAYIVQKQANFSLSLKLCNEALAIVQDEKNEKNAYIPKDDEFASDPRKFRKSFLLNIFHQLGNTWSGAGNKEKAIEYYKEEILISEELNSKNGLVTSNMNIGNIYTRMDKLDSAFIYSSLALKNSNLTGWKTYAGNILEDIGTIYFKKEHLDSAKYYYQKSLLVHKEQNNVAGEVDANISLARWYQKLLQADSMKYYANTALQLATNLKSPNRIGIAANLVSDAWKMQENADSALVYLTLSKKLDDSLHKDRNDKLTQFQNANFEEQLRLEKEAQGSVTAKNKIRTIALFAGLCLCRYLLLYFIVIIGKNKKPIQF
jgi:hypothetical protein